MPLPKYDKTLLVIVAEAVLERALVRDALALGAQTWTASEVHGAALLSGRPPAPAWARRRSAGSPTTKAC